MWKWTNLSNNNNLSNSLVFGRWPQTNRRRLNSQLINWILKMSHPTSKSRNNVGHLLADKFRSYFSGLWNSNGTKKNLLDSGRWRRRRRRVPDVAAAAAPHVGRVRRDAFQRLRAAHSLRSGLFKRFLVSCQLEPDKLGGGRGAVIAPWLANLRPNPTAQGLNHISGDFFN